MVRKSAILFFCILCSITIYAQSKEAAPAKAPVKVPARDDSVVNFPSVPAQTQYSDKIKVRGVNFSKRVDYSGEGEILEVQFVLENNLDEAQDLYLFIIATYEKPERTTSSFEIPVPEKERIRSFVPFPDDIKNFQYPDPSKENAVKLLKYPKNPMTGVDPATGKAYHLKDKLNIWTTHLSRYRNNFFFFNEVTILVYDHNGSPLFRQLYSISGKRV